MVPRLVPAMPIVASAPPCASASMVPLLLTIASSKLAPATPALLLLPVADATMNADLALLTVPPNCRLAEPAEPARALITSVLLIVVAETLVAATPPETARASSVPALLTLVALIVTSASPSPTNNRGKALRAVASAAMVLVLLTVPPLIVTLALPKATPADAIMEPELPLELPLTVTPAAAFDRTPQALTA